MPTSPAGSPTPTPRPRTPLRLGGRGVRLTHRGWAALAGVLALLLAVVWGVARSGQRHGDSAAAVGTPSASSASAAASASASDSASAASAAASSLASASASTSAGASASSSASALPAGATVDQYGLVHTHMAASRKFAHSTITIQPRHRTSTVHTFIVEVETSLPMTPNSVAQQVAGILNDPKGWTGMTSGPAKGVSFQLVSDPTKAQFVIHLATAQTVQAMCPLNTLQLWSCDAGKTVLLNVDRWLYATPAYSDVTLYRTYQVNHEVGHFLGFGHKTCPGTGKPAPVMMQQSKGLHGCVANAYPTVA